MAFLKNTWDLLLRFGLAALTFLQAQWADVSLRLLVALMLLDFLTGLLTGWFCRSPKTPGGGLSSVVGLTGVVKKLLILCAVLAAGFMDTLLTNPTPLLRHAVTVFYAANEALSLLENLALCGLPIPAALRRALDAVKLDRE